MIGHNQPPAAIEATFEDWRPVKSRKVLQLVLEVPIEQTEAVLNALGAPMPDQPKWVGVALLGKPEGNQSETQGNRHVEGDSAFGGNQSKERKRFEDLPASQQAGMLSGEAAFQNWIAYHPVYGGYLEGIDGTAVRVTRDGAGEYIRRACGVNSRAHLDTREEANGKWLALVRQYRIDTGKEPWRP